MRPCWAMTVTMCSTVAPATTGSTVATVPTPMCSRPVVAPTRSSTLPATRTTTASSSHPASARTRWPCSGARVDPDPLTGQYIPSGFVLRLLGSNDEIRFQPDGINEVLFSDGTVWNSAQFPQVAKALMEAMPGQTISWVAPGGADYLQGAGGNETIVGNDGNDVLDGGAGNDWLDGGYGSDTYVLKVGGGSDTVLDFANYQDSNRIVVAPGISPDQVALFWSEGGPDPLTGQYVPSGFVLRLLGSSDEIRFQRDSVQEVLFSDGTTWSSAQFPQLMQQFQTAMPGQGWLNGSSQADYLQGGSDSEHIYGGDANDVLDGGAGNDMLDGSSGSDTYVLRTGGGSDMVFDWANSGETNRIVVAPGIGPDQVALFWSEGGPDPLTGQYVPSGFVLRLLGSNDELRFQPDGINEVLFSDGTVWNSAQFPQLSMAFMQAMPGQDFLGGSWQADYLQGGTGNETLLGNDGNDVLDGGAGNDWLDGGYGSDTYVLKAGGGSDTVIDFAGYQDNNRIVVAPGIGPDQVELYVQDHHVDPITGQTVFQLQTGCCACPARRTRSVSWTTRSSPSCLPTAPGGDGKSSRRQHSGPTAARPAKCWCRARLKRGRHCWPRTPWPMPTAWAPCTTSGGSTATPSRAPPRTTTR
ncbi:MAG TPA: hypothetical protein DEF32_19590 [Hydrogenophaga sp.]|nr:hypothetical protein [Hydrogenophaga sp.]